MTAVPIVPLPKAGDIVWCRFPQTLGTPGPKPRPALVIAISQNDHAVLIAYGTSQKTNRIYPGEFLLDKSDAGFLDSGLSVATKFDLNNRVKVPFDSDWFSPNPAMAPNTPLPKLGVLHPSYVPSINAAFAAAKAYRAANPDQNT